MALALCTAVASAAASIVAARGPYYDAPAKLMPPAEHRALLPAVWMHSDLHKPSPQPEPEPRPTFAYPAAEPERQVANCTVRVESEVHGDGVVDRVVVERYNQGGALTGWDVDYEADGLVDAWGERQYDSLGRLVTETLRVSPRPEVTLVPITRTYYFSESRLARIEEDRQSRALRTIQYEYRDAERLVVERDIRDGMIVRGHIWLYEAGRVVHRRDLLARYDGTFNSDQYVWNDAGAMVYRSADRDGDGIYDEVASYSYTRAGGLARVVWGPAGGDAVGETQMEYDEHARLVRANTFILGEWDKGFEYLDEAGHLSATVARHHSYPPQTTIYVYACQPARA